MLFNTDHLDSKFDRLTLRECKQENIKGNDNSGRTISMGDSINGEVAARPIKDVGRQSLSLLSSSLAVERNKNGQRVINNGSEYENPYIDIDESMDMEADLMDDHPEPILLASSVGKEMDGRMIPSSSTISLLSLNAQNNDNCYSFEPVDHGVNNESGNFNNTVSPKTISNSHFTGKYTSSVIPSNSNTQTAFMERKTSHHNISSRNSLTHLSQQRFQQYQRFAGPPLQISGPQQEMGSSAFTQSIPIENKSTMVPDSPNLDPISVGGSPSGLWLTNQVPPRSSSGSKNNSRNQSNHMFLQQQQQQQQQPHIHNITQLIHSVLQTQPLQTTNQMLSNVSGSSNYTTTSTLDYIKIDGSTSPILHPVLTPSEDPPMTPLYLNSNFSLSDVGYFGNITE